ncbi:MAG: hypothetical protein ACP6IS_11615 [Candidatus Asgardarchaeia archaeon]
MTLEKKRAVIDTSAFANILIIGGFELLRTILTLYGEIVISSNLKKEYFKILSSLESLEKRSTLVDNLQNLLSEKGVLIDISYDDSKTFLDDANKYLQKEIRRKVSMLSLIDAECLFLVKSGHADIFITDDISCWLVAMKWSIPYSSSIKELYKLHLHEKINFITLLRYANNLFGKANWKPIRGYRAEIAMNEYFKIIENAIVKSKDKLKGELIKLGDIDIIRYDVLMLIEKILGCV